MKKILKFLAASTLGVALLAGCGANPQQAFVTRLEQQQKETVKQAAYDMEASVVDLEAKPNSGVAAVIAPYKDAKVKLSIHVDSDAKQLDLKGALESVPNFDLSPVHFLVLGEKFYANGDFLADYLKFQEPAAVSGVDFSAISGKYIDLLDVVREWGSSTEVQRVQEQLNQAFIQTEKTEEQRKAEADVLAAIKELPADRFTQNGDKVTLTLNPEDFIKLSQSVAKAQGNTEQVQNLANRAQEVLDSVKKEFQTLQFLITLDTKKRDMEFVLKAVPTEASTFPLSKVELKLTATEVPFQAPTAPKSEDILKGSDLRTSYMDETENSSDTTTTANDEPFTDVEFEEFYKVVEETAKTASAEEKKALYDALLEAYNANLTAAQKERLKTLLGQ